MTEEVTAVAIVEITGEIIPSDYKWIYDFFEIDNTTPGKIKDAIAELKDGEELEVRINSPGGDVASGQEIYSLLQTCNSRAAIMGFAASAAGLAAMGCKRVEMSPVSTIMVHNVWTATQGDYHEMERTGEMLKNLNSAIAAAYVKKTGAPEAEILEMMDKETWITANQAIELGIADGYIGTEKTPRAGEAMNSVCGLSITPEMIEQAKAAKAEKEKLEAANAKRAAEIVGDLDAFGI